MSQGIHDQARAMREFELEKSAIADRLARLESQIRAGEAEMDHLRHSLSHLKAERKQLHAKMCVSALQALDEEDIQVIEAEIAKRWAASKVEDRFSREVHRAFKRLGGVLGGIEPSSIREVS